MKNKWFTKVFKLIYRFFLRPAVKYEHTMASNKIPIHEIRNEHIQNAKLLATRKELLERFPKNGIFAEIGVDEGDFSEMILNINAPEKLHLIDFWGSKRYDQGKRSVVENKFAEKIEENAVEINIGLSTQVVDLFDDSYFDWIYIDTDHTYKTTIEELELYRNKVKENGIIAGHDYILGNWNGAVRYGVIEAVNEFCLKYDWEIIYITVELKNNPSFAIRKRIPDDNSDMKT